MDLLTRATSTALAAGILLAGCSGSGAGDVTRYFENSALVQEQGWFVGDVRDDEARYTVTLKTEEVLARPPSADTLLRVCPDATLDNIWDRAGLEALALELWDGGDQPRGRVDCARDFSRAELDRRLAAEKAELDRRQREASAVTTEQRQILRISYREFNLEGSASYQGRWIRLQAASSQWMEDSRSLQITFWPFRLNRNDVAAVSRERTLAGLKKSLPEGGFTTMPHAVAVVQFAAGDLTAANVSSVTFDLYGWGSEDELLSFDFNPRQVFQRLEVRDPKPGSAVSLRLRANDQSAGFSVQAVGVAPILEAN